MRKSSPSRPVHQRKLASITAPAPRCQCAFEEAQAKRRRNPLSSGAHKLREALRLLKQFAATIIEIERLVCGTRKRDAGDLLGCCTIEDKAAWLKSLPKGIAACLGYDVLPAIDALTGDGVSGSVLRPVANGARSRAESIVQECDIIDGLIRISVDLEYQAMRRNGSNLGVPIVDVMNLITSALSLAEPNERLAQTN